MDSLITSTIKKHGIYLCNYNEFTDVVVIGEGGYGKIEKAYWKRRGLKVALKSLKIGYEEGIVKAFIKELQLLFNITKHYHPNINQFHGVAKDDESCQYYLILQYANDGNLRDYLKQNFETLTWNNKLRMAMEIAKGVIHLHENQEKIIHRDLHSKNILVNDGKMMIADFGISKEWKNQMITTRGETGPGVPAYMDPKYLADHQYVRNEKSDVYSYGVLLWEISSGRQPFESCTGRDEVIYKIFRGMRETPVEGTPKEYVELYTRCWDEEPENRPSIQEAFEILRHMISGEPESQDIIETPLCESPTTSVSHESRLDSYEEPKEYLLKQENFDLISKWIDHVSHKNRSIFKKFFSLSNSHTQTSYTYDFKLLLRGSRDGFTPTSFHKKCDGQGSTLTVLKVKDGNEILGGYNPFSWESPEEERYYYTNQSFLFKFVNNSDKYVFSKAKNHESIKSSLSYGPYFRSDLRMENNFDDNGCSCYRWYYDKPIRESSDYFSVDEYEVFQVIIKPERD